MLLLVDTKMTTISDGGMKNSNAEVTSEDPENQDNCSDRPKEFKTEASATRA